MQLFKCGCPPPTPCHYIVFLHHLLQRMIKMKSYNKAILILIFHSLFLCQCLVDENLGFIHKYGTRICLLHDFFPPFGGTDSHLLTCSIPNLISSFPKSASSSFVIATSVNTNPSSQHGCYKTLQSQMLLKFTSLTHSASFLKVVCSLFLNKHALFGRNINCRQSKILLVQEKIKT